MENRAENRYDLVDGLLVSCAGMASDNDHTRLVAELCALRSRLCIVGRPVQTHAMPSVETLSAKEVGRAAAERKMV